MKRNLSRPQRRCLFISSIIKRLSGGCFINANRRDLLINTRQIGDWFHWSGSFFSIFYFSLILFFPPIFLCFPILFFFFLSFLDFTQKSTRQLFLFWLPCSASCCSTHSSISAQMCTAPETKRKPGKRHEKCEKSSHHQMMIAIDVLSTVKPLDF